MKCPRIKKVRGRFAQATLHQRDLAYQLWQAGPTDAEAAEKFFDATGIRVSAATLASFASSWPFVREQTLLPDTTKQVHDLLKELPDLKITPEQISEVNRALMNARALREQDGNLFVKLERLRLQGEKIEIDRRKLALQELLAEVDSDLQKRGTGALTPEQVRELIQSVHKKLMGA